MGAEIARVGGLLHPPSLIACAHGPRATKPRASTLVELLHVSESARPYLTFLDGRGGEDPRAHARVLSEAETFARRLLASGVGPEDRVVLLLPSGPDFVTALFGTQLAGAVPVPWPLPLSPGALDGWARACRPMIAHTEPSVLVTNDRGLAPTQRLLEEIEVPRRVLNFDETGDDPGDRTLPTVEADDVALIQFTSGQLSEPRGIMLTHRQVLANVHAIAEALRLGPDDVGLYWVPLVHDMGLVGGLFTGLYCGFPTYVMPPQAFLMRPHHWLQNISTYGATISAAPNFAYKLCVDRIRDRHLEGVDLSRWRLALNGSETVHPETVDAFAARFSGVGFDRAAMFPLYGLAENTLAVTCPSLDAQYRTTEYDGREIVSVGYPLPGQTVTIRSREGDVLDEGAVGEVVVESPSVMRGYFRAPEPTDQVLRRGRLHTGDLGFLLERRLHITGRLKDMVIKMGRNFYPTDIERLVYAADGVRVAVAFAVDNAQAGTEDLVLVVECAMTGDEATSLCKRLKAQVIAGLGIRLDRVLLVPPGSLPEQDRRARARRFAA